MKITFVYQPYESVGLEMLIAVLRKSGSEVNLLIDYNLFSDGFINIPILHNIFKFREKLLENIEREKPDLVAFSVVTDNYQWAKSLAQAIKTKIDIPILFGGVHPTIVPEVVISEKEVDILCRGEGELSLLELAGKFDKTGKILPKGIKNLWYKDGRKIFRQEIRPLISDLNKLPFADKSDFFEKTPRFRKTYGIMTSRGCPYGCSYCWNSFYRQIYEGKGKYLRRRSVGNVIRELEEAKVKWDYKRICFMDDLFTFDIVWLREFKEIFKKSKAYGIPYSCQGHPKLINREIVSILKDTGCDQVNIGIQTGSSLTRKSVIFRPETEEEIINSSKLIKEAHMNLFVDHIGALPGEGEEEQLMAARLYNKIRPDSINFSWLRCYPGTKIQKIALGKGELNEKHVKLMDDGEGLFDPYSFYGKRSKEFVPFEYLFGLLPVFPPGIIKVILDKKLYRFFKRPSYLFGQALTRVIVSFFRRDTRLISSYLERYSDILKLKTQ